MFDQAAVRQQMVKHLVKLGRAPGWRQYTLHYIAELEADGSGLWDGLHASVKASAEAAKAVETT